MCGSFQSCFSWYARQWSANTNGSRKLTET